MIDRLGWVVFAPRNFFGMNVAIEPRFPRFMVTACEGLAIVDLHRDQQVRVIAMTRAPALTAILRAVGPKEEVAHRITST